MALSAWLAACQAPVAQVAGTTRQPLAIPGRLILPTRDQRQLVLGEATLRIFSGGTQVGQVAVRQNRFSLPVLEQAGPYTYRGEGIIERIQADAVPIGGSQGGVVPISGSQGGLRAPDFALLQNQTPQPGQTITFQGRLDEDLTRPLAQLDIQVPSESIHVEAKQSIVNVGTEVQGSVQTVINGNIGGGVTQHNNTGAANRAPLIAKAEANSPGKVPAEGGIVTLEAEASDPDGDPLHYEWKAERGTLSSSQGRRVSWTADEAQGPVTGIIVIELLVSDAKGGETRATLKLIVSEVPKNP